MKEGIRAGLALLGNFLTKALIAGIIFLLFISFKNPMGVKAQAYGLARDVMKKTLDIRTFNWYTIHGEGFSVKYQPADASVARLVLETAEASFEPVNEILGFTPKKPVPIFVYPTSASLNKSFGWDASVNAMGVYWAGTIRILSPLDWIDNEKQLPKVFREKGPIAHEYAHFVVDYRTHGNYPRWLTEGIAQYIERELTGFELTPGDEQEVFWYSFGEMDRGFDLLSDQGLAYRQSLLALDFIVAKKGFPGVLSLLDELAQGQKIGEALDSIMGLDLVQFEQEFKEWVQTIPTNPR